MVRFPRTENEYLKAFRINAAAKRLNRTPKSVGSAEFVEARANFDQEAKPPSEYFPVKYSFAHFRRFSRLVEFL